jgi:hypothetical protein
MDTHRNFFKERILGDDTLRSRCLGTEVTVRDMLNEALMIYDTALMFEQTSPSAPKRAAAFIAFLEGFSGEEVYTMATFPRLRDAAVVQFQKIFADAQDQSKALQVLEDVFTGSIGERFVELLPEALFRVFREQMWRQLDAVDRSGVSADDASAVFDSQAFADFVAEQQDDFQQRAPGLGIDLGEEDEERPMDEALSLMMGETQSAVRKMLREQEGGKE